MSSSAILIPRPIHSHSQCHQHSQSHFHSQSRLRTPFATSAASQTELNPRSIPHKAPARQKTMSDAKSVASRAGDESDECESDVADVLNTAIESNSSVELDGPLYPRYDQNFGVNEDSFFMNLAIEQAQHCEPTLNAYSVGAVLVSSRHHVVISTGFSRELEGNTHAEECALIKYKNMWNDWSKRKRIEMSAKGIESNLQTKRSQDELEEQTAFSLSSSSSACSNFSENTCTGLSASASSASLSSSPGSARASPAPNASPMPSAHTSALAAYSPTAPSALTAYSCSSSSHVLDSVSDALSLSSPFPLPTDFVMYTTMEPCSQRLSGKRACSWRLLDAAIQRVVVGALEPAFFVKCDGIDLLRSHDIHVSIMNPPQLWQKKCLQMNAHIYAHNAKQDKQNGTAQQEKEGDRQER